MRKQRLLLAVLIAISGVACNTSPRITVAKEERAVRATDAEWLAAVKTKDVDRALTFWSDDAIVFAPNAPAIVGKEAIRKYVSEASAIPGFSITWATDKVWISASGDLAYSSGTSQITVTTPDGKAITERNKGLVVWKKQADGSWKCVVDIWNAETPAATK
jgi:ketosteroid isomerase-like protein